MAILVENNVLLVLACLVVLLSEIAAPTSKHCAYIVFPALTSPYTLTKYENTLVNLSFRLETDNGKCTHNASEHIFIYVYQPEKSAPFCTVIFRKGNCTRVTFGKEKCRCDKLVSNGAILKQCVTLGDHGVWNWNSGDTTVRKESVSFGVRSGATDGLAGRGENCITTEDRQDDGSLVTSVVLGVLGVNVVTIIVVVVVLSAYRGKFSRKQGNHTGNPSPRVQEEEEYMYCSYTDALKPGFPSKCYMFINGSDDNLPTATKDENDYGYATVV